MVLFLKLLPVLLLDTAAVTVGALLLWANSGYGVFAGSTTGIVLALAATTVLLVFRQLMLAAVTQLSQGRSFGTRREFEILVGFCDVLLLVAAITVWGVTGRYLLGWFACFAAALLMIGSALQLMIDVFIGPQRQRMDSRRSVAAQRVFSLEMMRLLAAFAGITGLVITSSVHEWQPLVLNPLILSLGIAVAVAAGITAWLLSLPRPGRSRHPGTEKSSSVA